VTKYFANLLHKLFTYSTRCGVLRAMYISKPHLGLVYGAQWNWHRYQWLTLPLEGRAILRKVSAAKVPLPIRKRAYAYFYHQQRD
jgi:hypothetical protein